MRQSKTVRLDLITVASSQSSNELKISIQLSVAVFNIQIMQPIDRALTITANSAKFNILPMDHKQLEQMERKNYKTGFFKGFKNNSVSSLTQDRIRGKSNGFCCKCGSKPSSSSAHLAWLWWNQAWGDMSYKPLNQSHIQLTLQLLVCHQHTKCRCLHELCSVPLLNETLEKQRLKGECVSVWRRLLLLNKEGKVYNQKRKTLKYTLR